MNQVKTVYFIQKIKQGGLKGQLKNKLEYLFMGDL
jgi:hypothetical protein